jgi:hypothetical protein
MVKLPYTMNFFNLVVIFNLQVLLMFLIPCLLQKINDLNFNFWFLHIRIFNWSNNSLTHFVQPNKFGHIYI